MSRPVTSVVCLFAALCFACGDDAEPQAMRPEADGGGKEPTVDAGEQKDAAEPMPPACDDNASTPGNDCPTAVACLGAPVCGLADQSCCAAGLDTSTVACVDGLTCEKGSRATCDGPEDCDGKACCVDITAGTVSCQDSCNGSLLCHTDEDCPAGNECEPGAIFTWWGVCK